MQGRGNRDRRGEDFLRAVLAHEPAEQACKRRDPESRRGNEPDRQAPFGKLRELGDGRRGTAHVAFLVPPPRSVDEEPHALLGGGLVQEAVHLAAAHLGGERRLFRSASGHNEHEVRKLTLEAADELCDRTQRRRRIDHGNACAAGDQLRGQIGLRSDKQ